MKRANNIEIIAYDFPNIQCGFIKIDVNDLANQIRDFYVKNSQFEQVCDKNNNITIEKTYTNNKIISFEENIIHSLRLIYNQFLKIKVLESALEVLDVKVFDQTGLKNIFDSIENAKEHVSKIDQEFLIFFNKLSELIKFEIEHEHSIKINQEMRKYHISKHNEFVADKLKLEGTNLVNNHQQNIASPNTSNRFDYFAYHISTINDEPEEVLMRSALLEKIKALNLGISDCAIQIDDLSSKIDHRIECEKVFTIISQKLNDLIAEGIINPEDTFLTGADENELGEA